MKGVHDTREILEEAKIWVDRSGHDRVRCLLLGLNSYSLLLSGQYQAAMKAALEGLELAEKIGEGIQKFSLLWYAAEAALGAGHGDSAFNFIQRGISEGEKVGHPLGLAALRLTLAKALLRSGRVEESIEPAEAALKFFQALDMGTLLQRTLEIYAEILANWMPKDEMQIDKMMDRAAALVERSSSPWDKIEHLGALARISLKRGRPANARKSLIEARSLYRKVGLEDGTEELRSIEEALEKGEEKGGPGVR
jgi:tetratricopeptide (TPR) repeat protein